MYQLLNSADQSSKLLGDLLKKLYVVTVKTMTSDHVNRLRSFLIQDFRQSFFSSSFLAVWDITSLVIAQT